MATGPWFIGYSRWRNGRGAHAVAELAPDRFAWYAWRDGNTDAPDAGGVVATRDAADAAWQAVAPGSPPVVDAEAAARFLWWHGWRFDARRKTKTT